MKRLRYASLLIAFCFTSIGFAQTSIVEVTGTVTNAADNSGVKAVVSYKSLPDGGQVGRISSADDGTYKIYLHAGRTYSVTVDSDGFFAKYDEILASSNTNRDVALESGDVGHVFTLENLTFDQGSSQINERSHSELDNLVSRLNTYPAMEIQLEGHTDFRGNADLNMNLSQERVDAVKAYLTSRGITSTKVLTKAFGGTQPVTQEDTPEGHAQNRRVEVRILKVE